MFQTFKDVRCAPEMKPQVWALSISNLKLKILKDFRMKGRYAFSTLSFAKTGGTSRSKFKPHRLNPPKKRPARARKTRKTLFKSGRGGRPPPTLTGGRAAPLRRARARARAKYPDFFWSSLLQNTLHIA